MRKLAAIALLPLCCAAGAFAQAVAGLGAVSGTVRDASGAAVPGATVVVTNEAKGIKRTIDTTEAGIFSAPALPPASGYAISVTKQGFSKWEAKDFEILVGQTIDFRVNLQVGAAATTVEVTAEAPLVEETKTGVSQVVEKSQIDNLPINGRRVDSFVLLTPAVTNDGEFGLVSFRGIAGHNSFLTDGNDTTQSFYNENAGRTRISTQLSQDAVQEFQVLSNGFSAEFGRALGGVVNTVTRSGTNDIHGTAFWFFRNRTLNATDRYAGGLNAPEWRHQTGGTLGGPIKKDKLFFFLNAEFVRRNFPGQNRLINSAISNDGNTIIGACPGTGANPPTQAQCDAAIAFIRKQMNVLVPRTVRSDMGFGKIDWRPTDRNSFSFSANVMHWDSPHGIQTQAVLTSGNMLGNNANSTVETRYGRAAWTSIPTNSSVNEFRFGWFKDRLSDPQAADLFPSTGALAISLNGANIGAGDNYPRTQPNEVRYQFVDNFSWIKGAHAAKFGFDIATTSDYVDRLQRRYGSYSYANLANFARDFSGNTTGAKSYQNFQQGFGNPIMDIRTTDFAFYAQDVWKVSRKLTLNYGLRYEYAMLPQQTITNPFYPQTGRIPKPNKNFAPRVNISYALDDKTVLRAGYGIFYGRYQGALLQTLFFFNNEYQKNYTIFPNDAGSTVFPNILASPAGSAGTGSIEFADKDLHNQYTQQGTVALERQFGRDIAVTASYMWTRGIGLYTVRDLNIGPLGAPVTYTVLDAALNPTGQTFTTPTYRLANRVDTRFRSIFQIENGGQSWYNGLSLQVRKRFSHGFTGAVAYTWSHAIDTANLGGASDSLFLDLSRSTYNGDYSADKGSSLLDQRHRLVVNFLWRPKFVTSDAVWAKFLVNGWELSSITTLATPKPAPATVSGSPVVTGGALANTGTLNGFFGSNRVPFWPFNPLEIDTIHRVDARLQRDLPISERIRARLSFEAFNVFNTISNTFINTQAYTVSGTSLRPNPAMGVGTQSQGFPDGTNARRMQAGLRFEF